MKRWLQLFVLFLFQFQLTFSQESVEATTADSVITIGEVTVHAFNYETRLLEVPASISVITEDQLEQITMQTIDVALNKIPGIYMQHGTATTNRLTIRGVGSRSPYASNKIRAYYAGIPLTNGVGETTIEDLNKTVLSKVEIIKGPASGFYGAGLGGTLLFEAIHPDKDQLTVNYGLSSYQTHQTNANLNLNSKNARNQLAIESLNSAGYRRNNETNRVNLNYIGQFTLGKQELNLIVNQTDLKAFIPSSLNLEDYQKSPEQAAISWTNVNGYENYQKTLIGVSLISPWKNNWTSTVVLFAQNRSSDELRPFNFLHEDSHYYGNRIIVEKVIHTENSQWKFLAGNENFFENYDWSTVENESSNVFLSDNKERRNYTNLFTQVEFQAKDKCLISLGANYNQTHYDYTNLSDGYQSASHSFNPIISPRLAINYSLTKRNNVFAQISHGFSPPSLEETLLPEGGRNTEIRPETGWNYEIGSRGYLFGGLYYDFSFYFMMLKNLLVARRVAEDAYMGINAGETAHPGLEYYLQYKLPSSNWNWQHEFSINGSFTPYYFIEFVDGENDYSWNELTGNPRYQNNLQYQLDFRKRLMLHLHYRTMSRIPLRDDNSIYADPYSLLNLDVQFLKAFGNIQARFVAGISNVTNEHYSSMVLINANSFGGNTPRYYYPGAPRNYRLALKLAYRF